MYSLISIRIIFSSLSNNNSVNFLANWVFPTPVGPRKINEPIGFLGSLSPALLRCIAITIFLTASSWPITLDLRVDSISANRSISCAATRCTGIPVIMATTSATCSSSTNFLLSLMLSSQALFAVSSLA